MIFRQLYISADYYLSLQVHDEPYFAIQLIYTAGTVLYIVVRGTKHETCCLVDMFVSSSTELLT